MSDASPRFGRRRLFRDAADAVTRRFAHLSGAEGSADLLRSPASDPDGAGPDKPPELCPGIRCIARQLHGVRVRRESVPLQGVRA